MNHISYIYITVIGFFDSGKEQVFAPECAHVLHSPTTCIGHSQSALAAKPSFAHRILKDCSQVRNKGVAIVIGLFVFWWWHQSIGGIFEEELSQWSLITALQPKCPDLVGSQSISAMLAYLRFRSPQSEWLWSWCHGLFPGFPPGSAPNWKVCLTWVCGWQYEQEHPIYKHSSWLLAK